MDNYIHTYTHIISANGAASDTVLITADFCTVNKKITLKYYLMAASVASPIMRENR